MSVLFVLAPTVGPALLMFYAICRRYTLKLRAGDLRGDWDAAGVFCFAVLMGIIWPLTVLWLAASRPSRDERRLADQQRVARIIAETERRAKELGVGQ